MLRSFYILLFLERQMLLLGAENTEVLNQKTVMVVGLGGVGGAASEALLRAGIGRLILVDHDVFDETNLNRQILSTYDKIGEKKVLVAKERFLSIVPGAEIHAISSFYSADTSEELFAYSPDFVIDAIDSVDSKVHLAKTCYEKEISLVSSMGAGNRIHPECLRLGDLFDTGGCGCGLAKVMRRRVKAEGINALRVVYSTEHPIDPYEGQAAGKRTPGSISFVPPVAGYFLAGETVRTLLSLD